MLSNQLLMSLINEVVSKCPVPERILTEVKFGAVDSTKEIDSMNPLIDYNPMVIISQIILWIIKTIWFKLVNY